MVKMKPQREEYEQMIAQAAILMGGWMTFWPEPECAEQKEVLDATRAWLSDVKTQLE
jgi:hypothetical protein